MIAGQRKPDNQWTGDERKAANLDQRLKSLIMYVLPDDQMNFVIKCLTTKSTWDDLILYHEVPSDVKESRVMDLKLCYNTFKFKEGESLTQTFARYKALMNELVNDGIKLSKLEINNGFVNGLPKKWLSFCQSLKNTNNEKDSELASLFGKHKYVENLIDSIYETEKNKSLVSATPLSTTFFSSSIVQDFKIVNQCISEQIPSKKKGILGVDQLTEDPSSSGQKDLLFVKSSADDIKVTIPGVERSWLSEAEGFILPNHDTGRILPAESQRNTTDPSVAVTDSSATDYDSVDEPSVCSTPPPPLKKLDGVEPIYGPKTIKSILRSKFTFKTEALKGVIINETSSALAKGNKSSSALKVHSAPAGKLKSVKIKDDPPLAIVMKELNNLKLQVSKNHSSYSRSNQSQQCEKTDHRTFDHAEYISTMNMSQHLKSLGRASLRSKIPRPSKRFFPPYTHCGCIDHLSNECLYYHICGLCKNYDHDTNGHNRIISLEREINPRNPQHTFKRCEVCGSLTHTTTDHYDIKWFKRGEVLQAKKADALNQLELNHQMLTDLILLLKGPKVVFGDDSTCITEGYGSIKCNGIVFTKFDEKRGTIFNSNKEVVMIAPRLRDVYVLNMTSTAQEYQTNSNDVSFIEPYEYHEPFILETKVSSDQNGQTDKNDHNDHNDQNDQSVQNNEILNDDHSEHSNHTNDEQIIDNLLNTKDIQISKHLSSPSVEDTSVQNTIPIPTPSLPIPSMVTPAPQYRWLEAIRIFLAFATYMNFIVYKMDVKRAFLNGKLKEEVYVKQPPGFENNEFPNHVYKLNKALYGLKQALRAWYLKGTPSLGLWYPKCSGFDQKRYSDSDYAGCNMDRKSTSAVVGCCANILWMRSQLTDCDIIYEKVPIFCDNTGDITIFNNPVLHSRTKHIDISYHLIRDHVLKRDIELHFIPTQYQLVDIFTKPLDEPTFKRLFVELGMLNINSKSEASALPEKN
ncbi:retrovirus-related pol polyprotein from transposon TNT 1-94 [Tanacetum coccineum]